VQRRLIVRERVQAVEQNVRATDGERAGRLGNDAVHAAIHAEIAKRRFDDLRRLSSGCEKIIFIAHQNLFIGHSDLLAVGVKENVRTCHLGMLTPQSHIDFDIAVVFLRLRANCFQKITIEINRYAPAMVVIFKP